MSLFGLAEKKRIAVLENQVAAQQQLLDQMLKLTERSMDAYAKAHNIANEALAIVKGLSENTVMIMRKIMTLNIKHPNLMICEI